MKYHFPIRMIECDFLVKASDKDRIMTSFSSFQVMVLSTFNVKVIISFWVVIWEHVKFLVYDGFNFQMMIVFTLRSCHMTIGIYSIVYLGVIKSQAIVDSGFEHSSKVVLGYRLHYLESMDIRIVRFFRVIICCPISIVNFCPWWLRIIVSFCHRRLSMRSFVFV